MKILPLILSISLLFPAAYAQDNQAADPPPAAPKPAAEEKPAEPAPAPEAKPQPKPAPTAAPKPDTAPVPAPVPAPVAAKGNSARIVVEASGDAPKPPTFYSASIDNIATIDEKRINYQATLRVKLLQGEEPTISLHTRGIDDIVSVSGKTLSSWSVRWDQERKRYLELKLKPDPERKPGSSHEFKVRMRSPEFHLPARRQITNFAPGAGTASLHQVVELKFAPTISGKVLALENFLPVAGTDGADPRLFQSNLGGEFLVEIKRSSAIPADVELSDVQLLGIKSPGSESIDFQLTGTARVTRANAHIDVLRGDAAITDLPISENYRLKLVKVGKVPVYRLTFPVAGEFPLNLGFVAGLQSSGGATALDFSVAGGAVVPVTITGLDSGIDFQSGTDAIVPVLAENKNWLGFVPANGRTRMLWKSSRKVGEGRLFFSTIAQIEAALGAGLLRQQHDIEFRILQGELKQLDLDLIGPGEVLSVEGNNITAWSVNEGGDGGGPRRLEIKLSQSVTDTTQIRVRTRTALDALPVRTETVRLTPVGTVRHSGYLRVSNQGSVRLEPADLDGLTQLAPDQYPGGKIEARQVFAYRFPASDHSLSIAADRIEPEVSVSEVTVYRLAETDRMLSSDIELDIREAPIREWDIGVPEDYSIVTVVGASVADYVPPGSEVVDGRRNLKVLFNDEVSGRQLIQIHLEKNEAAVAGDWLLPSLKFPRAKSVRGDVGVIGEAGYRVVAGDTTELVEKPLSLFPKSMPGLQQAFRIREADWTATVQIEVLEQSVQADVFHLHSLNDRNASTSVVLNYLITGAPVSEWRIALPDGINNVDVEGRDIRISRRDEESGDLIVSLQQPVMGLYQLLVTYEEDLGMQAEAGDTVTLSPGRATPVGVQDERGFIQIVSPVQVDVTPTTTSKGLLKLDAIELPAELRLQAQAPALGSWQYTERPFQLDLDVRWFEPGSTLQQVVDFVEVTTTVSADGELVSEALYYVRSRGQRALRLYLPEGTRLWAATVRGRTVAARQGQGDDDSLRIPLPGSADPNLPVEVRLRVGKPAGSSGANRHPRLALPVLSVPTLKADWHIVGDKEQVLRPTGGTVAPVESPHPLNGAVWLAKSALGATALIALLSVLGLWLARPPTSSGSSTPWWRNLAGILAISAAIVITVRVAEQASHIGAMENANSLQLSLPAIAAGEMIQLDIRTLPAWRSKLSVLGIFLGIGGIAALVHAFRRAKTDRRSWRAAGALLISIGILLQANSALVFLILLALVLGLGFLLPRLLRFLRNLWSAWKGWRDNRRKPGKQQKQKALGEETSSAEDSENDDDSSGSSGSTPKPLPTSLLILAALLCGSVAAPRAGADDGPPIVPADSTEQSWTIEAATGRVQGDVKMQISGKTGDQFLLLAQPAVMTEMQADEAKVRISKKELPGRGLCYIAALIADGTVAVNFRFDLRVTDLNAGFAMPTGDAAVQRLDVSVDKLNWEILCPAAVKTVHGNRDAEVLSTASLLLAPGKAVQVSLRPKPRDVSQEETRFYVEADQLYLPGPGVIDGHHQLHVRPSQGQVSNLSVAIPSGLTVSTVEGPIASWQFDADNGKLELAIEPPQANPFTVKIGTQRGLDPLPSDAVLQPLRVDDAAGEVGLIALAFGPDSQPEKAESDQLPTINAGDFNAAMLKEFRPGAVLHRVFRYSTETDDGNINLSVAPVAPEIRVSSKQVLSFGDERVVLSVQFAVEISRAGVFQLSFPLPDGFEVESLTGPALHHWSELTDGEGRRQVVLHLNGKTLGSQNFSLTLTGAAPELDQAGAAIEWTVPRFELNDAERHIGDLIVNATTGIRLRSITGSRDNASEVDPRSLGGNNRGALAFRLLQAEWTVVLGVEQLAPWITANVLHDVTLREGQTRTTLLADFEVRNASIRSLPIQLPITNEDEIKTVRASGSAISDLVRLSPDSDIWELRFKRRVVGKVQARIEYDRRESRDDGSETLQPVQFPEAGQVSYHFAVRSSGRFELVLDEGEMPRGWQPADWTGVSSSLREAGVRTAPNLTLRAVAFDQPLTIQVDRHALAETLKLRVANGTLTTILSPLGDRVTAVELAAEVIQRGSLTVTLPDGGQLFSIFVNNESVHSIREGDQWRFHVLPGVDQRYASVHFIYSAPGSGLRNLDLQSPPMNVPLENITWRVVAPPGFHLTNDNGDLQLSDIATWGHFDRQRYLAKAQQQHDAQAQHAAQLLERAGQFRQQGKQDRALWALNSVVNQYALDAATNEDARVQLENLQTQNTVVGLNTRRQRLYLDGAVDSTALAGDANAPSEQLKQGAAANPVLQDGRVNVSPQDISQLMQGNSGEDNAVLHRIGTRMVQQQRSAEPATQALTVTLPEEGTVYSFNRAVQVSEDAPLELELSFDKTQRLSIWRFAALVALLAVLGFALVGRKRIS